MVKDRTADVGAVSLVFATALCVAMVLFGLSFRSIVLEFKSLFLGFGADLPPLTAAVISYTIPIWLALVVCLAGQVAMLVGLVNSRTIKSRDIFYRFVGFNALFIVVLIVSMYLPIFKLGAVV